MSEELKPVFCGCGGEAKVETDHDTLVPGEPIDWKRVRCSECNIRTTWRHTEAEAVTAWNTAMGATDMNVGDKFAKDTNVLDKVRNGKWKNVALFTRECSECGAQFHELEYDNFCPNCGTEMTR